MHNAHWRGEKCGPNMQRKYFMFKSDLFCLKTEIYFTSSNSVGKPVYPVAQVEVPSLILVTLLCLFLHVPAFHRPVDSKSRAYLQAIWVCSSLFLPPSSETWAHFSPSIARTSWLLFVFAPLVLYSLFSIMQGCFTFVFLLQYVPLHFYN